MVLKLEKDVDNVPFIQIGKHQLRLDMEELDDVFKERAKNELRETPEVVEEALCRIKEYVSDEKRLQVPLDDDSFFLKFLRPFKFNVENTCKVLTKYYKFKVKHPKFGDDIHPSTVHKVFDNEVFVFLPTRTSSGARLMVINAGNKWNPKKVSIQDIFRAIIAALEIAMMEPKTQVGGVNVILNMEGFSLVHVAQLSPSFAKIIVDWIQECAAVRLNGIHIVNQSYFFNVAYAIFKPFIGEQLRQKISFHGYSYDKLCEQLSQEALPKCFGGSEDLDYPGHLMSEMLFHYEKLFEKHSTYGYVMEK